MENACTESGRTITGIGCIASYGRVAGHNSVSSGCGLDCRHVSGFQKRQEKRNEAGTFDGNRLDLGDWITCACGVDHRSGALSLRHYLIRPTAA